VADTDDGKTAKRHGLQGPIDDAFMDSFIMVRPTGASMNAQVGAWATNAMAKAVEAWRLQFRGEPRVKDDTDLSDEDIAGSNLVLWGDPDSNVVLRRIMDKLPMKWTSGGVRYSGRYYSSKNCVPILIYPNPLNPKHYVVLNSGFTFAEAGVKSNALQVPQLPDFVVIDINAGNYVLDAGFFDEGWRFPIIQ
jgi:hypothetical protein